jgi:hypothetical protein
MATRTAKCDLQMAQQAQFLYKNMVKFIFDNKQLFCLLREKSTHYHVDEIDA